MPTTMSLNEIRQRDRDLPTDKHSVFSNPPLDDAGNRLHVTNEDGPVDIRLVARIYGGSWITGHFARLPGGGIMEPVHTMRKIHREREAADREIERLLTERRKAADEHYTRTLESYLESLAHA